MPEKIQDFYFVDPDPRVDAIPNYEELLKDPESLLSVLIREVNTTFEAFNDRNNEKLLRLKNDSFETVCERYNTQMSELGVNSEMFVKLFISQEPKYLELIDDLDVLKQAKEPNIQDIVTKEKEIDTYKKTQLLLCLNDQEYLEQTLNLNRLRLVQRKLNEQTVNDETITYGFMSLEQEKKLLQERTTGLLQLLLDVLDKAYGIQDANISDFINLSSEDILEKIEELKNDYGCEEDATAEMLIHKLVSEFKNSCEGQDQLFHDTAKQVAEETKGAKILLLAQGPVYEFICTYYKDAKDQQRIRPQTVFNVPPGSYSDRVNIAWMDEGISSEARFLILNDLNLTDDPLVHKVMQIEDAKNFIEFIYENLKNDTKFWDSKKNKPTYFAFEIAYLKSKGMKFKKGKAPNKIDSELAAILASKYEVDGELIREYQRMSLSPSSSIKIETEETEETELYKAFSTSLAIPVEQEGSITAKSKDPQSLKVVSNRKKSPR